MTKFTDKLEEAVQMLQYGTIMSDNQEPMLTNNRNIARQQILAAIEAATPGVALTEPLASDVEWARYEGYTQAVDDFLTNLGISQEEKTDE